MNRLELFRFGNTRRRRFAVYVITVAAVFLAAALFMVGIGFFSYRSELVTVTATETDIGDTAAGTGVNAELIPNVNMVCDSSFESRSKYYSMLVAGNSGNSVYLKPDAVTASGFDGKNAAGSSIRIVSIDADGVMNEKYSGTVPSHLTPLRAYETKNPLTAKPVWFGISQESRDHAFGAFRAWPGNDRVLYRINPY